MDPQAASRRMSATNDTSAVDIQKYDEQTLDRVVGVIGQLYALVYQEPPYCEGPEDVDEFVKGLPRRAGQPAFRSVVAMADGRAVGFAFGHQLAANTRWWQGATSPLPEPMVKEDEGRTFAIIEIAVVAAYRRRGIAKAMHDALLAGATEERATLLVRPEATPAQTAYERWGYTRVATIRPWPEAPLYDAMLLSLRR
jgi:ribosomal protein S18 acetylase RimI-like enzyme